MIVRLLYVGVTLSFCWSSVLGNDCIFHATVGAFNAAGEAAVSVGVEDPPGYDAQLTFAPASMRSFPKGLLENQKPEFFDLLLRRRQNSRNWLWGSLENSQRIATGMAHVIDCVTERYARSTDTNRHSLCIARVGGDLISNEKGPRCDFNFTSLLLIGESSDDFRSKQAGTQACWCESACKSKDAIYQNTTSPAQNQTITSYVVLDERQGGAVMKASEYEEKNNKQGEQWYTENLLNPNPPIGKGIFPRKSRDPRPGTGGTILRSLRLFSILESFSSDFECPSAPSFLPEGRVDRMLVARVEEELGRALQQGIDTTLAADPVRGSDIILAVTTSLFAAVLFSWKDFVMQLISRLKKKESKNARKGERLLICIGILFAFVFEVCLELSPIYVLLQEEIAARDAVEIRAFEIIGAGNEMGVIPLRDFSGEEFLEAMSGFAIVVLKNRNTKVVVIAVAAAFLTCLAIGTTFYGIVRSLTSKNCATHSIDMDMPVHETMNDEWRELYSKT